MTLIFNIRSIAVVCLEMFCWTGRDGYCAPAQRKSIGDCIVGPVCLARCSDVWSPVKFYYRSLLVSNLWRCRFRWWHSHWKVKIRTLYKCLINVGPTSLTQAHSHNNAGPSYCISLKAILWMTCSAHGSSLLHMRTFERSEVTCETTFQQCQRCSMRRECVG